MADKTITMRLRADTGDMSAGLRRGAQEYRAFNAEIKSATADARRYQSALDKQGDKLHPQVRRDLESNVVAATERKETLQQAQAGRSDLQRRLAIYKEQKAAEAAEDAKRFAALQADLKAGSNAYRQAKAAEKAVAASNAATMTQLQHAEFAATHTTLQVQLRDRQAYYAELRTMHAGNAAILAQIDRSYRAEVRKLEADAMGSGGVAGGSWMDRFGGKKMVKQELKFAAGSALGMHGGELGIGVAALLSGSVIAGGVAATMIMIGSLYEKTREHAKALRNEQDKYRDSVREAAQWARELTADGGTNLGGSMVSRLRESAKEQREIQKEHRDDFKDLGVTGRMAMNWQVMTRGGYQNTDFAKTRQEAAERIKLTQDEIDKYTELLAVEQQISIERRQRLNNRSVLDAWSDSQEDSPHKRGVSLRRKQAGEMETLEYQQSERLRAMELDKTEGHEQRLTAEQRQQAKDREAMKSRHLYETSGLERREREASQQEAQGDAEARLSVIFKGHQKERALLVSRQKFERDHYTGSNATAMLSRQGWQMAELDNAYSRDIEDNQRRLKNAYDQVTHSRSASAIAWEEEARALVERWGDVPEVINAAKDAFDRLEAAKTNQPLLDGLEQMAVRFRQITHELTALQAAREQLRLQNRFADPKLLDESAKAAERLRMTEWVKGERTSRSPKMQADEYRRQLREAIEAGAINAWQAETMMRTKLKEMTKGPSGGDFTDPASHWRTVQSQLSKGGENEKVVQELQQLREEIRRGVKLVA